MKIDYFQLDFITFSTLTENGVCILYVVDFIHVLLSYIGATH